MSLDSIINITISTNSLQMAQTGFGVPLIIANNLPWTERVKTFSYLSDLLKEFTGLDTKSKLYLTAKALVSQNPKVPKFKIGKREDGDKDISKTLQAICDADSDFYGVLLVSEHNADTDEYIKEVTELVSAVSTRRLLAGVDFELAKDDVNLDGFKIALAESKRIFAIHKTAPKIDVSQDFPAAAWMGKMLSQAPGSASWAFKQLEGVSKAQLSTDIIDKLQKANINRYINIKDVGVTLDGRVAEGEYIDIIHGIDWLHVRIQERLFKLLMVNPKIPFTLQGVDLVRSEIMAQLKEAVYRGLLAADPEPMVSIPNIEDIDPTIRGKRILPDVHFSGRLAGAIHHIEIQGKVTT